MEQSQLAGAGRLMVMVAVLLSEPRRGSGLNVMEVSCGGRTVSVRMMDTPPSVAVIVTLVEVFTADVVIGNIAVVSPIPTISTLPGTDATVGLLLVRTTLRTKNGDDGGVVVTVPVELSVPNTEAGFNVRLVTAACAATGNNPAMPLQISAIRIDRYGPNRSIVHFLPFPLRTSKLAN